MASNSMQRVLTTLAHQEDDRVPFFLLLTTHGSKELGLSIKDYFVNPENIANAQIMMQKRYRHDSLYGFWYAALEIVAWGGEAHFTENSPPIAGEHPVKNVEKIIGLSPPKVAEAKALHPVLEAIKMMKDRVGDTIPIIGVVMSPFSLPVMQIGFDSYFEIMYERPALFQMLMQLNSEFCVEWANAQLAAGATAICYFDPISSPTIIPREMYQITGFKIARDILPKIKGPTAIHFASGRVLPIADMLPLTGTAMASVSGDEDLAEVKKAFHESLTIFGNLNGIAMRKWSVEEATRKVKEAIRKGAPGGGFVLSDHHGEIPYQVSDDVLMAISEAVHKYGKYPIQIEDF